MARLPRYAVPGIPQHVIHRGNNRSALFLAAADYEHYRQIVRAACERHVCAVHAYVLMTNHVHLLITPSTADGIGRLMQSVGRRYVRYFNDTYERTGTLWEGRYRAAAVETDRYLLTCYRYIEQNPVRAGMVGDPGEYCWSSYRANALGIPDPVITVHDRYMALDQDPDDRRRCYRALLAAELDERTIGAVREAVQTGWALGGERFCDELTARAGRRTTRLQAGRRPAAGCRDPSRSIPGIGV